MPTFYFPSHRQRLTGRLVPMFQYSNYFCSRN